MLNTLAPLLFCSLNAHTFLYFIWQNHLRVSGRFHVLWLQMFQYVHLKSEDMILTNCSLIVLTGSITLL